MAGYTREEKLRLEVLNRAEEKEHFHQDIELVFVLEGELDIFIGGQKIHMEADDVFLINAAKHHAFKSSGNILYAKISIVYAIFSDVLGNLNVTFWCDSTRDSSKSYDELRNLIRQLLKHYLGEKDRIAKFGYISLCYQIIESLSANFLVRSVDKEIQGESKKFEERIILINNYIQSNYFQQINLKKLSEQLFLSVGYLSRFFKKNYGMNFADYLTQIRLCHAVDELLYTDNPITRIAYDNGFSNVAAFNKAIRKEYGETPSTVRKRATKKANQNEDTAVLKERLEQLLWEEKSDICYDGKKENISCCISGKKGEPLKPIWNQLINVGSAEELLKSEVREHIILLKSALDFEYMRFWSPFTEELLININAEEYNFSRIDYIIDFLVQQGIKPHIELASKPRRVQKNAQESLVYETRKTFDSIEKWDCLIEAFMKHILQRYSKKVIDNWKMELWYEESYLAGADITDKYFEMFSHTYKIVKRYSENMEIGGCGMQTYCHTDRYSEFMKKLYRKWNGEEIKPDFISVMSYPYITGITIDNESFTKRNTDSDFVLHCIEEVREDIRKCGLGDIKLYITEWNLTISDRNLINDSCYKGAYIVKNYIDLYGEVDEMAYFQGSDRSSEYYDTNALLYGGTGLISRDGILKPAGFAVEFLNRSYPYFIDKGSNYIITTDAENTYGIVCHNCKELNYNYFYTNEDKLIKEHMSKYFEDKDPLNLCIQIQDVENGSYQIKIYRINERYGSVFNLWGEMGYEKDLSRKDIKYFRRVCEPKLSIQKCEVKNGNLNIDIQLSANEIAFIRSAKKE